MIAEKPDLPAISTTTAVALLVLYTLIYVLPFYISSTTRPSAKLSRDAPSVIRGRIQAVIFSCFICSVFTFVLLSSVENGRALHSLHLMGYIPFGFPEAGKCLALTCILFLGPLFEAAIVEGRWRDWIRFRGIDTIFGGWIGYRNYIAGPITEEVLFRSTAVPLFLLARTSLPTTIFLSPLIFGLAHVHHFYEFRITHPHTSILAAALRSLFQLAYTTLFGAYVTFLYLRTGSLIAIIVVHTFCNMMGLPRFWGRLDGPETLMGPEEVRSGEQGRKRDEDKEMKVQIGHGGLHIGWTVAYYVLLVTGAVGWYKGMWVLTESSSALTQFS